MTSNQEGTMEVSGTTPSIQAPDADVSLSAGAAFVEARVVGIEEARVPIIDTGFSRSDLTYDVVAVWEGAFFRLEDHLDRFERGCRRLRLEPPHSRDEIRDILIDLVRRTGLRRSFVEMICTRGISRNGVRDPRRFENRFYAYAIPYVWLLPWEERDSGMDAVITQTVQRIPSRAVDPTVKNFHWGDLTRGLYEAYDRGARFPILLDGEGHVTEGAGYNVFAVVDGRVLTPDSGALEGITRRTILELARRDGLDAVEQPMAEQAVRDAGEMFATSTAGGVMPITTLDGTPVGKGGVGPVTQRLRDLYWAAHEDPAYLTRVDYAC
jgi:branched-chain amino acid aminotransferase